MAIVLLVALLLPLLIGLFSWAISLSALHSAGMLLLSFLVAVVAFSVSRDLHRGERRSLRTR